MPFPLTGNENRSLTSPFPFISLAAGLQWPDTAVPVALHGKSMPHTGFFFIRFRSLSWSLRQASTPRRFYQFSQADQKDRYEKFWTAMDKWRSTRFFSIHSSTEYGWHISRLITFRAVVQANTQTSNSEMFTHPIFLLPLFALLNCVHPKQLMFKLTTCRATMHCELVDWLLWVRDDGMAQLSKNQASI